MIWTGTAMGVECFVTGTDTGVGKTVVAAVLARALAATGPTLALKPVATGVEPGSSGTDAVLLGNAAGHPPMARYTFREPLSPHRAAAMEGRTIEPDELVAWIRNPLATHRIVEGVGGWRVPLTETFDVRDLATALGIPVVVVAADRLGALNHTLLTVESIRDSGLPLLGVVLNRGAPFLPVETNLEDLTRLLKTPVVPLDVVDLASASQCHQAGTRLLQCLLGAIE